MRFGLSTGCLITKMITIRLIIQYSIDRVLIYGKSYDTIYDIIAHFHMWYHQSSRRFAK